MILAPRCGPTALYDGINRRSWRQVVCACFCVMRKICFIVEIRQGPPHSMIRLHTALKSTQGYKKAKLIFKTARDLVWTKRRDSNEPSALSTECRCCCRARAQASARRRFDSHTTVDDPPPYEWCAGRPVQWTNGPERLFEHLGGTVSRPKRAEASPTKGDRRLLSVSRFLRRVLADHILAVHTALAVAYLAVWAITGSSLSCVLVYGLLALFCACYDMFHQAMSFAIAAGTPVLIMIPQNQ